MKLTLEKIAELAQDQEYRRLPQTIALARVGEEDSWTATIDALGEEGMKATVWHISQLIAVLFDTYEGIIHKVSPRFSIDQDAEDAGRICCRQTQKIWGRTGNVIS